MSRGDERVTVVIPTRAEAGNIGPIIERLTLALGPRLGEIVFVDDSDDETPETIEAWARRRPGVRLLHRPEAGPRNGLAGAVLLGIEAAGYAQVCVMDGDLQHPPEVVPRLLQALSSGQADLVLASRFLPDSSHHMSPLRRGASWLARMLARAILPARLRAISDPMTGFFVVDRRRLSPHALHPIGWKILLEILFRHPELRVSEVGFTFAPRHSGRSKASTREFAQLIRHLLRMRRADHRTAS